MMHQEELSLSSEQHRGELRAAELQVDLARRLAHLHESQADEAASGRVREVESLARSAVAGAEAAAQLRPQEAVRDVQRQAQEELTIAGAENKHHQQRLQSVETAAMDQISARDAALLAAREAGAQAQARGQLEEAVASSEWRAAQQDVSYTHLTLPTIYSV